MRITSSLITMGALFVTIMIQAFYLKSLPGSLVRVYYTEDSNEFNKPPGDDMTAEFDGYRFDYRIISGESDEAVREIRDRLGDRKPADMKMLIDIATRVRSRMSFGRSVGPDDGDAAHAVRTSVINGALRGLCDGYARSFAAACQAAGIPARVIELNGHVVPEAFLRERERWVMIDPTLGYYVVRAGVPLSVAEIIRSYKNGNQPGAVVFATARGDDSLYRAADEDTLRGIYLNGFTVVSNQQLEQQQILSHIATTFSLPIAKVQYVDGNTVKIGRKEIILRSVLTLNIFVFILVALIIVVHAARQRPAP